MGILEWKQEDVSVWLMKNGFEDYVELFVKIHKIDGKALIMLTESDLRQPPLNLATLGDIKRLMWSIRQLQLLYSSELCDLGVVVEGVSRHSQPKTLTVPTRERSHRRRRRGSADSQSSDWQLSDVDDASQADHKRKLEPEMWKTAISVLYFFLVTWITAIVMVIVHDRVPDMDKYPPLPDIFLDNVPRIPWAFDVCEVTGCILGVLWITILVFHKHRFILLRRMFSLLGSVFLLRCVTMLITSLSVPGRHLDCKARPEGDFWATLYQAFGIWRGAGMSIQGVRTCGDYMFSGHTIMLTMLNFFLTEYTPRNMYYLHTFTWVLNMFGIFFILAAHEHYSIDVFIAFYISTRLFLYYHTLANNRDLMQRDSKRTRIWFPLFSFFEGNVGGMIPNTYEWPLDLHKLSHFYAKVTEWISCNAKTS